MTVDEATSVRAQLTGDAAKVAKLVEACLNAEASFRMLGFKPKRRGFQPVGVQSLTQIEDLLKTMPVEVDLVSRSMAFACEFCGMPAVVASEDCWICDACIELSTEAPHSAGGED